MGEWSDYMFSILKDDKWSPEHLLWIKISLNMYEKQGLPYGGKLKNYLAWSDDRGLIYEGK